MKKNKAIWFVEIGQTWLFLIGQIETGIPGQNNTFMMNSATYFIDIPH